MHLNNFSFCSCCFSASSPAAAAAAVVLAKAHPNPHFYGHALSYIQLFATPLPSAALKVAQKHYVHIPQALSMRLNNFHFISFFNCEYPLRKPAQRKVAAAHRTANRVYIVLEYVATHHQLRVCG